VDAITDPSRTMYVLFLAAAGYCAWRWSQQKQRSDAILAGVFAGLFVLLFVCDTLMESGREQAVRRVREMSAAVGSRDAEALGAHVSESFRYRGSDKKALLARAAYGFRIAEVTEVVVWGFGAPEPGPSPGTMVIPFSAKVKGELLHPDPLFDVKSTFVRDSDGQWRMQTFTLYRMGTTEVVDVPGL
jgi:hypothetical protein